MFVCIDLQVVIFCGEARAKNFRTSESPRRLLKIHLDDNVQLQRVHASKTVPPKGQAYGAQFVSTRRPIEDTTQKRLRLGHMPQHGPCLVDDDYDRRQ